LGDDRWVSTSQSDSDGVGVPSDTTSSMSGRGIATTGGGGTIVKERSGASWGFETTVAPNQWRSFRMGMGLQFTRGETRGPGGRAAMGAEGLATAGRGGAVAGRGGAVAGSEGGAAGGGGAGGTIAGGGGGKGRGWGGFADSMGSDAPRR